MLLVVFLSFTLATGAAPMDVALKATEAPNTFRAAFTVHLQSARAERIYQFDPRLDPADRWQVISWRGEDDELEEVGAEWAREPAPDGRLFPDDLRASLGSAVVAKDMGYAWKLSFRHLPSRNDGPFDVWAAERLNATAWLDPVGERLLRIDYKLPAPVRGPEGGRLMAYEQSYLLQTEPRWGMSYVASFAIALEARAAFKTLRRDYSAQITNVEFFFASDEAERAFEAERALPTHVPVSRDGLALAGR